MGTTIGRTLSELDSQIKSITQSAKQAQSEAGSLDKAMQMNPASVEAVSKKYQNLATQLQLTQQKMQLLKQKQTELTTAYNQGTIKEQQYNKQLASVANQLQKATTDEQQLKAALEQKNAAMAQAQMTSYSNALDKLTQKTKKLSTATTVLVGALAAVITYATKTGDELYDTATKYDTSVEKLQIWENRLNQAASDSEAYVNALSSIGTIQSAIVKNGGTRYASLLKQIGLTTEDLNNVTKEEAFDMIFEGLQNIEDESTRATVAQGLFGDSGLDIATIAGLETEEINALDDALMEAGIISTESAAAADELNNQWTLLKQEFSAVALDLLQSLMPAIESLIDILKTTVIPIIEKVCDWLGSLDEGQQKVLLVILMLLIFLPKLTKGISGITSAISAMKAPTLAQAGATSTLSAASTPLIPIFLAIAVALLIVITLMSVFSKSAKETADSCTELLNSVTSAQSALDDLEDDLDDTATIYNSTNGKAELDVNVEVDATGDTPISQDNADSVGDAITKYLTADDFNELLGAKVK